MLFVRIKRLCEDVFVSQAELARRLDIEVRTFQRYVSEQGEHNLWPLLKDIEMLCPQVRREWLWWGEGDMLGDSTKPLKAENATGQLVGDLFSVALDYYGISNEDIVRHTSIPLDALCAVLDSRALPDFRMMEELYRAFGIAPTYLFHGNEHAMREPQTALERAAHALGHESRYVPTPLTLEEWFGASKEDAKAYLQAYREGRKNLQTHGAVQCEKKELPTEPVLADDWITHFETQAQFIGGWLRKGSTPFLKKKTTNALSPEALAIERENNILKNKLIAALEENTRLHERIHGMNEQAGREDSGFREGSEKMSVAPKTAARGAQPDGQ